MPVKDLCCQAGISPPTYFTGGSFYRWKSKYGGLGASDLKQVREGSRERQAQAPVGRVRPGQRGDEGPDRKKTVGPAQKREGCGSSSRRTRGRCAGPARWWACRGRPDMHRRRTGRCAMPSPSGHRRASSRLSRPRLRQVLPVAQTDVFAVEPQTHLPGVLRHEAQPAPGGRAPPSKTRTRAVVRAPASRHGLVGRLHARRTGLWPPLAHLRGPTTSTARSLTSRWIRRSPRSASCASSSRPDHCRERCTSTTGRSFWARFSSHGGNTTARPSGTSSPESRTKTPTWTASTAPTGRKCWINTCSPGGKRRRGYLALPDRLQRTPPPRRPRRHDAGAEYRHHQRARHFAFEQTT